MVVLEVKREICAEASQDSKTTVTDRVSSGLIITYTSNLSKLASTSQSRENVAFPGALFHRQAVKLVEW